MLKEGV